MITKRMKKITFGTLGLAGFIGLISFTAMAVPCTCGVENGYDSPHQPNMRICITELSDSWTELGCSERCGRVALITSIADQMRTRSGDRTHSPGHFSSVSHISDCESWCNEKQSQGIQCLPRGTTDSWW